MSRVISLVLLAAVAYWYWSGPFQARHNPNNEQALEHDIQQMRQCVRGQYFKVGATGQGDADPEALCAARFNLYFYEGEWRRKSSP
ncbi:MAG: hypothetical protein AAGF57_12450 [Pseudomonadota bacterium]